MQTEIALPTHPAETLESGTTRRAAGPQTFRFHHPDALPAGTRERMWELFARVTVTDRSVFDAGLAAMQEVWVLEVDGVPKGFGGVRVFEVPWGGRTHDVLYTGQVFLDPSVRGTNVIQRVGARYFLDALRRRPFTPKYWMFGAASYKSYLLLARNYRTYWPHSTLGLPERERGLLESVMATMKFPRFDPRTGVVAGPDLVYLDANATLEPAALADPDVAFYARINPGQSKGDYVMCLCPLDARNWATCAARAIRRTARRR
jgi:hypothetical protein